MRGIVAASVVTAFVATACVDVVEPQKSDPDAWTSSHASGAGFAYSIMPLAGPDSPPGFAAGRARAINNRETAAGWVRGELSQFQAVLWEGGKLVELPGLGGLISEAADINDWGDVVGSAENANGEMRAVLWRKGSPEDLGTLGGSFSSGQGINNRGQVVGVSETSAGEMHAFLWSDGRMEDLGRLPGTEMSVAADINERGEVVGYSIGGALLQRATLWRDGGIIDLGTLGQESGAFSLNARGQIVGASIPVVEARAVMWERGEIRDLGTLADDFSSASGINNSGQVVGATRAPNCSQCPFLWERGTMRNLGTLDDALASASDINEAGTIVGSVGGIGPVLWTRVPPGLAWRASLGPTTVPPDISTSVTAGFADEGAPRPWAETVCTLMGNLRDARSALELAAGC